MHNITLNIAETLGNTKYYMEKQTHACTLNTQAQTAVNSDLYDTDLSACACTHAHTCMHIHMHARTHTYTHTLTVAETGY